MNHRYENDRSRSRGWDRPRDESGRFESEFEQRGGRGANRYGSDEYSSRNFSGRNDFDRHDEYSRGFGGYGSQRNTESFGDADRPRGDYYDMDERNQYAQPSREHMNQGAGSHSGYEPWSSGQRFGSDRSEYSQNRGFGGRDYQGESFSGGGNYTTAGGYNTGSGNFGSRNFGGGGFGGGYRGGSLYGANPAYSGSGGNSRSSFDLGWQESGSRGQFSGRGPKGYRRSDDRITEDVNEALSQHPEIDASEIEVKVNNGEVTLSGTVSERQFKRMAEDVVERCPGVHDVRNEIRVQSEHESRSEGQNNQQMKGKSSPSSGTRTAESKTA